MTFARFARGFNAATLQTLLPCAADSVTHVTENGSICSCVCPGFVTSVRFVKGGLFVQTMSVLLATILRQMSNLSQVCTDFPLVMSRCSVFLTVLQTCFVSVSLCAQSCDLLQ